MDPVKFQAYLDLIYLRFNTSDYITIECNLCSTGNFLWKQRAASLADIGADVVSHVEQYHQDKVKGIGPSEQEVQAAISSITGG